MQSTNCGIERSCETWQPYSVGCRLPRLADHAYIEAHDESLASFIIMKQSLTDVIGWFSTLVLLATLIRQIVVQWHDKNSKGVSAWLFVGQLTSSSGFIVYSALVGNRVFVVTNSLIAAVAILGELVYLKNQKALRSAQR